MPLPFAEAAGVLSDESRTQPSVVPEASELSAKVRAKPSLT